MAITRRKLLIGLGAGGAAAIAGGSVISSLLGGDDEGSGDEITLSMPTAVGATGWPWAPLPDAELRREAAWARSYHEVMQEYLADHPGLRLRWIEVDAFTQDQLVTAISGGAGPSIFPGLVLGNWNMTQTQKAFAQGMAADITELLEEHQIESKLTDLVGDRFGTWAIDGRHYAMPDYYSVGNGIYYRRDLIQELGLPEPEPGYTWADLRELALALTDGDRKGVAFQKWGQEWILTADGWFNLTKIPAPGEAWHWRYDYTTHADTWVADIEDFRAMIYEDESVLSDVTLQDAEVAAAFTQGRAAIFGSNAGYFTGDADQDTSIGHLAQQMDRPIGEVIGFIQHPRGRHGNFGISQPFMAVSSFSPDLSQEALEQIVALHDYMTFGEGWTRIRQANWEETQDLQKVYNDPTPINGITQVEGVPGSFEDAWGPEFAQAVTATGALAAIPGEADFFPVEENQGPDNTPITDKTTYWAFERGDINPRADLEELQRIHNEQAASFSSSIDAGAFTEAANEYYDAYLEFWRENAPEYASEVLEPWMENVIRPALEA